MVKSIRQDLSIRIGMVIFCISVVIGIGYYLFSNYHHEKEFKHAIANQTKQLSDTFTLQLWLFDLNTTRELCELFSESPEISGLRLRDHKKKIVFEKTPPPEVTAVHVNRELHHKGEKRVGYLDIYYADTSREQQRKNTFIMGFLMVIGTIAGSFLFINILLKRYLSRPLEDLQKDMDLLTKGDFPQSGQVGQRAEIQSIINTFNKMTISLRERDEEVTRKTDALKTEISERKQVAEALRESEERFKIIATNTPDHILMQDKDLRYIYVLNPQLGLTEEDMVGKTDFDFLQKEDATALTEIKREVLRTGTPEFVKVPLVSLEGDVQYFEGSYIPRHDPKGETTGLIGYFRNVTESVKGEEALKESEQRYKKAQRMGHVGNWEYDLETENFWGSDEAKRIYGFDPGSKNFTTEEVESCIPERERVHQALVDLIENNMPYDLEFDIQPVTGPDKKIIKSIAEAIRDASGLPTKVVGVVQDITAQKEAEKAMVELERQLRQSQKMEAVGTLAGGIAHDFNNILGIILGNAELAMDDVPDWNPARANLEEIKTGSLRAKDVVRQLLSFSRKTELYRKPIEMNPIVQESIKLLRASIPATIEIRLNIPKDMVAIKADPTQIHQVLINLCTNAAHAMEKNGGILEISLEQLELAEKEILDNDGLKPGAHIKLTVKDTGHGMEKDVAERIFDPYFTTKDVGKGTGMGLAVVHGIVQGHKGSISVESMPGRGTTFILLFPMVEIGKAEKLERTEKTITGNERILFVDDEATMVDLNRQRLVRLGYNVIGKTDPSEALAFFRANCDQIDLVITDMTMPKMTGDKLAQEILKIRPDMPIILCTGYSEKMSEDMAQEMGIRKYVEKPIEKETLAITVREVLDGRKTVEATQH